MLDHPDPLRGSVHHVDFVFGRHPALVLSQTTFNASLNHVVVVVLTGTAGPSTTHIGLGAEAGLTRYDISYCDITTIQPVDRYDVLDYRGLVSPSEMRHIEGALRTYLGL